MVVMSTPRFDPTLHPREVASGQFATKTNDAPLGSLDFEEDGEDILVTAGHIGAKDAFRGVEQPTDAEVFEQLAGRAPEAADAAQVTELADAYGTAYDVARKLAGEDRLAPVDPADLLDRYVDAKADYIAAVNVRDDDEDAFEAHEDTMMALVDDMAVALREQQNRAAVTAAPTPSYEARQDEWKNLVTDIGHWGGDEIRALDDKTLLEVESYLLRAAERVQAARQERGITQPDTGRVSDANTLEVIRYDHITEKQASDVWIAAQGQGVVGGVIRTKGDFYDKARDELDIDDDALIDRAWEKFSAGHGLKLHDADDSWGEAEYESFVSSVEDALDAARD